MSSLQTLVRPAAGFTGRAQAARIVTGAAFLPRASCSVAILASHRGFDVSASSASAAQRGVPGLRSLQFNLSRALRATESSSPAPNLVWYSNPSVSSSGESILPEGQELLVVLLGWLGAEQRHLRKYAEWYNSRGIQAATFVMPMNDLFRLNVIETADKHVESLYLEITRWLSRSESGSSIKEKSIIFHTFSNTGWFFYGAILEHLHQQKQQNWMNRIKGCIIDSAPAAELSPQVWASGFATAFLKKQSFSTQSLAGLSDGERALLVQPKMSETLLLALLEKFFTMLLSIPAVKQRLLRVISILSTKQPPCPQLYLYSSADRVIPSYYIENFIAAQKKAGYKVSSYNLKLSPHVDHLRNFPVIYCGQLEKFIRECLHAELGDSEKPVAALKTETVDW